MWFFIPDSFLIIIILLLSFIPALWNLLQVYYYRVGLKATSDIKPQGRGEKFFSVIIAVKGEDRETIKGLIDNLSSLDYRNYEVIIVSDDDETHFKQIFGDLTLPKNFRIFRRDNPKGGKAGALNFACSKGIGDYFVFLDADARVDKEFLKRLNKKDFNAAAFKISIYGVETELQKYYRDFTDKVMISLFRGRSSLGLPIFPNGSAFSIKRDTLWNVGMWKEGVIAEDLELGIRLFLKGVKVEYFHDITVLSKAPYTLHDLFKQIERWAYGSSQILLLSLKMLGKGFKGVEGFIYAQQWGIYPLFLLTLLFFNGMEFLLGINQLILLLPLIIYGVSTAAYVLSLGQKEGDFSIVITIINASTSGYWKGLLKIPYKWRVTPKQRREEESQKSSFKELLIFLFSFINSLYGYWLSSLILLGLAIMESLA